MPEIATRPIPPPLIPECRRYPTPAPSTLQMRLPFGLNIQAIQSSFVRFADADDAIMKFIANLQPALSPFMSVLVLAALAKAFYDFAKSAKEAVSSLSVSPIVEAIEKIVVLLPKLFEFIPPLNYIPPIIDLALLVVTLIETAINSLIVVLETEILRRAFDHALETNPLLFQFETCITAAEEAQRQAFAASIQGGAAPIICILAQLLDLIDFSPIQEFIKPLRDASKMLRGVTASSVNPDLVPALREVQELLGEVRRALEPFAGTTKLACD